MIPRVSRKAVVFLSAPFWFSAWTVPVVAISAVSHNMGADLRWSTRLLHEDDIKDSLRGESLDDTTRTRKSVHLKSRDTTDNEVKTKSREKGLKKRSKAKPPVDIGEVVDKQSERQATLLPMGTTNPSGGCQLNENGLYGQPDALSDVYTVQYLYQTSVFAGTSMTQLDSSVIQDVDNAITTSILPSFFDCANTVRRRRHLQGGFVQAISSEPVDTFVPSGLSCTKLVDNSDCYVVQGFCTVLATGFRDIEELEVVFKEAIRMALQGNAILSNVDTSLILDISALSDDLQTLPPIDIPASIPTAPTLPVPGPAPVPTITLAPYFALSDAPVAGITFAPVPELPTRPIVETTEVPIALPQIVSTGAPAVLPVPTPVVATGIVPTSPVASPVSDVARDQTSSDGGGGLDWWAWLFVVVAGGLLALCCLMIFRGRQSSAGSFGTSSQERRSNLDKDDAARRDDTDDPPYEPPPSTSGGNMFTSPGMDALSNNPPVPDLMPPTKDEASSSALFVNTAPTFISDTPDFVDDEPEFGNTIAAYGNNADAYDEEEEEEEDEEPTVSYSDDLDEDAEEEDGIEDEYDDVEGDEEEDEVEEVGADAFEEEASSYEEEELFEQESQQSENWGNPPQQQQQFNSRF